MTDAERRLQDKGYAAFLDLGWHKLVITPTNRVAECFIRECTADEKRDRSARFTALVKYLRDVEIPTVLPAYSDSIDELDAYVSQHII